VLNRTGSRIGGLDPESVAAGVEQEFHTVDLATRRLTARADSLVEQLPVARFSSELRRSVLEANSRPHVRLADLAANIAALRRAAITVAQSLGLGIVAAGTVPIADPDTLTITPDPRYEHMGGEYRMLVHEQLICGTRVRVYVNDRRRRARGPGTVGRVTNPVDGIDRDFYVRQLKDWKFSVPIELMLPQGMGLYARLRGWTLARAHARSGDRIALAAYLGGSDRFDQAIADFAETYADQNELDHAALQAAVRDGRAEATPNLRGTRSVHRSGKRPCPRPREPAW
jgi:hypothetical protein